MDRISMAAIVVGLIALLFSTAALVAMPEGPGKLKAKVAALDGDVRSASRSMDGLSAELGKLPSGADETSGRLEHLRSKLVAASERTAKLERAVAEAEARPAAAGAAVKIDEATVARLVERETRSRFDRGREAMRDRIRQETSPERFQERLGISKEKATKLSELYRGRIDSIGKIWRENRGGNREKNIALMREVMTKSDAEVAELLTPEELKKYKEARDRMRRGMRGRRPTNRTENRRREQPAGGGTPVF